MRVWKFRVSCEKYLKKSRPELNITEIYLACKSVYAIWICIIFEKPVFIVVKTHHRAMQIIRYSGKCAVRDTHNEIRCLRRHDEERIGYQYLCMNFLMNFWKMSKKGFWKSGYAVKGNGKWTRQIRREMSFVCIAITGFGRLHEGDRADIEFVFFSTMTVFL